MEEIRELKKLEHNTATWPESLKEIAAMIGPAATIALVREYGGRSVYFPESLRPGHHLAKKLGRQAALRLSAAFGRNRIVIPANRTYLRWYDARVLKLQGKPNTEISRLLHVTKAHVDDLLEGFDPAEYEKIAPEAAAALRCPSCGRRYPTEREAATPAPIAPAPLLDLMFPHRRPAA